MNGQKSLASTVWFCNKLVRAGPRRIVFLQGILLVNHRDGELEGKEASSSLPALRFARAKRTDFDITRAGALVLHVGAGPTFNKDAEPKAF